MDSKNLSGILDKIDELQALFIFGQRVIPFLEELFHFVHDIVPAMEDINLSIRESASKMPHVSSQLNKVNKATELAANEILDNLDRVLSRLNAIETHFQVTRRYLAAMDAIDIKTVEAVGAATNGSNEALDHEIVSLHEQKRSYLNSVRSNMEKLNRNLKDIRTKSNDIMISLQVQDITSQQIAYVNHLIESVQERLSMLLDRFEVSGVGLLTEIEKVENHSFDPHATYDHSSSRQKTADDIIMAADKLKNKMDTIKESGSKSTSQEEIDRNCAMGPE